MNVATYNGNKYTGFEFYTVGELINTTYHSGYHSDNLLAMELASRLEATWVALAEPATCDDAVFELVDERDKLKNELSESSNANVAYLLAELESSGSSIKRLTDSLKAAERETKRANEKISELRDEIETMKKAERDRPSSIW